jgi:flagellar hook-length control protein FliK
MSRVQADVAAGWLAQEATPLRSPTAGDDSSGAGSFGQHLEQAQRLAAAPSDSRPEAPSDTASPGPSESRPQQDAGKPPNDDSPAGHSPAEPQSTTDAADVSENAGSGQEQQPAGDDRHDGDKESDSAADAAAAGGAVAATVEISPHHAENASPHDRGEKPARSVESTRTGNRLDTMQAAARKQTGSDEVGSGEEESVETHVTDTFTAPQPDVDAIADAGGETVEPKSGRVPEGTDSRELGQGQLAAVPEMDESSAVLPEVAQSRGTSQEAQETQTAPTEADARATQLGSRRTKPLPGAREATEPQASQTGLEAAAVDASVAEEAVVLPDDSETAPTDPSPPRNKHEVAASHDPTDLTGNAKLTDPAASRGVPARASDAVGQRSGEVASSDAADRARFVQRVARAFESAADRGGHVRLRLYPPELGSLRLDLTVRGGHLSARLETDTESARNMLLENLPALKERLAGHHIQVERFDIEWRGHDQGGLPQRSGDADRWQAPSPGRAARTGGAVPAGLGPEGAGTARRLNPGTSFDVVI